MKTVIDIIESFKNRKKNALLYKTDFRTFKWTYEKLYIYIKKFANFLERQGLKKKDKVIIWAPNMPEWVISCLGTIYYGAIVVPADLLANPETVENIAKDSKPKLIIKTKFKPKLKYNAKTIFIEELGFILDEENQWKKKNNPKEDDIIELVYTSGTTGDPKGVILTHKNIVSNVKAMTKHITLTENDHSLSLLPLSHLFEQVPNMLSPLAKGGSITYISSLKASLIFGALEEGDITIIIAVPRLLQSIKKGIEQKAKESLKGKFFPLLIKLAVPLKKKRKYLFHSIHKKIGKHFRFFVSGGAPLDEETEDFWNLLGFKVIQGYGLTECSPVLTANTEQKIKKQSVGIPLDGVKIKLDEDGEILAKGDNVFQGYYHDSEKTKKSFKDGWFCTGDVGEIDKDGFLYIKGRKKDVIVTAAGVNVYPDDVEEVLNNLPNVKESCVIGLQKKYGEEVHAVIIPDGRVNIKKNIEQANEKLDSSKRIMSYTIWHKSSFPKTSTLKIKKNIVKEQLKKKREVKEGKEAQYSKISLLLSELTLVPAEKITPNKKIYSDLKIDSIGRVELVSLIEKEYNFDFEEELINDKTTVKDLENMIEKRKTTATKIKYPEWTQSGFMHFVRLFLLETINLNILRIWCKVKVKGLENLEGTKGPVIFTSNHVSYFDYPCVLIKLPKRFRYRTSAPAWAEFFSPLKKRIIMWLWKRVCYYYSITTLGLFPLSKEHNFKKGLMYTGKLIDNGENIIIFPEGERTTTNRLLPFKKGTAVLVQELMIPVIPVGIKGVDKVFPRGAIIPKHGTVIVNFGKPIYFKNESIDEITARLREEIEKLRK